MPKRKKRELQHLRQSSARRRNYQLGNTSPADIYKPGFPMNIFSNVRLFALIGIGVIVSFVITAVLTNQLQGNAADQLDVDDPTPSPTVDASATVSPTAVVKSFSAAEDVIEEGKTYTATIKTNKGDIVIDLWADQAPNTVNSFVFLAQQGFFDGITFHRVIPNFVIQAGDPTGTGSGGPGYNTQQEPNEVRNTRGTISMAKVGTAREFGSQFFINLKDNTALDYDQANPFYPFGEVTEESLAVIDAIAGSPIGTGDRPDPAITIETVEIASSDS